MKEGVYYFKDGQFYVTETPDSLQIYHQHEPDATNNYIKLLTTGHIEIDGKEFTAYGAMLMKATKHPIPDEGGSIGQNNAWNFALK